MKTLLHVGCGTKRKDRTTPGFNSDEWNELRLDIDPAVSPDITASITDMSAVADASVDALFSSHNVEHLYPHEVPKAFAEFKRVLKPDGFAVVTCPDLQAAAELVAADKLLEPAYQSPAGPISAIDMIFGHRASVARGNAFMAHHCGFTVKALIATFHQVGFLSFASKRRRAPAFDIWALATVSQSDEAKLKELSEAHFPG